MTNAGNRAARPVRPMCTSGTSKSNRTDQQAKTRAIEHAPIDLTSRRPTPDAVHVTGGSLPGHPSLSFHLRLSYLLHHHPLWYLPVGRHAPDVSPDFPESTYGRSNRATPPSNPDDPPRNVRESFVNRSTRTDFSLPFSSYKFTMPKWTTGLRSTS